MDQITSPTAQLKVDAAKSVHAIRVRPMFRVAARLQLAAATNAATASPMSSTSIVAWSLIQWRAVHAAKKSERTTTPAVARANGRQSAMPRPRTATGLRTGAAAAAFCTDRAYAEALYSDPA